MIHRLTYIKKDDISPLQKRQCQGGAIMVWEMTIPNGIIYVKIMERKQDSEIYISLFKDFAVPIMNLNFRKEYRTFTIIVQYMFPRNLNYIWKHNPSKL